VLTVPKIKDLVNTPNEKYKNIYDTISHTKYNDDNPQNQNQNQNKINFTLEDILPPDANKTIINNSMKNELKNFIKKQLE
jgi:hypothetical protein